MTLTGAGSPYYAVGAAAAVGDPDSFVVTVSDGQATATSRSPSRCSPLPTSNQPQLIVDGSVGTGGSPSGVAVSGDKVFVTNQVSGR